MTRACSKPVAHDSSLLNTALAVLFAAVFCLSHIHQGSLSIDGIRYAHIANHILKSGNWFTLWDEYTGQIYANKPPALFWLTALSIRTFGFSTFSARLPGAVFALAALLMLFQLVRRFYGTQSAFIALVLLVLNSVFFRAVADLSFEGLLLCGALSCLHTSLKVVRGTELQLSDWPLLGLGLFLCSVSKPPYILIILFPMAMTLAKIKRARQLIIRPSFFAGAVLPPVIGLSWYLFNDAAYLKGALNNQIVWPFILENGFAENLAAWVRTLLISYAPLTWLGVISLFKMLKTRRALNPEEFFLLCWLFPALPMLIFTTCRAPYLLVPFLTLVIVSARWMAAALLQVFSVPILQRALLTSSLLSVVLINLLGVKVHKFHPLLGALKQEPALIQQQNEEPRLLLCLNGKRRPESPNAAKRAQMLIELELKRTFPVYDSNTVPLNELKAGFYLLADTNCREALFNRKTNLAVIRKFEQAALLKAAEDRP